MSDLISLLPPNATPAEKALEAAIAPSFSVQSPVETLWSADQIPLDALSYLAWGYSIDFWRTGWSEAQKRGLTAIAPDLHRLKGTRGGIEVTLEALGFSDVTVFAWYEYGGDPYHFRVDVEVSDVGISDAEFETVVSAIETTKSVRDRLERFRIILTARNAPLAIANTASGEVIDLFPWQPDDLETAPAPVMLAGLSIGETITLQEAA